MKAIYTKEQLQQAVDLYLTTSTPYKEITKQTLVPYSTLRDILTGRRHTELQPTALQLQLAPSRAPGQPRKEATYRLTLNWFNTLN